MIVVMRGLIPTARRVFSCNAFGMRGADCEDAGEGSVGKESAVDRHGGDDDTDGIGEEEGMQKQ